MHSSDEHLADETMKQATDEMPEQQGFQPLYEFPPSGPLLNEAAQPAPISQVRPEAGQGQEGFVYPPPPSYYQNMVMPPQRPLMQVPSQSRAEQQAPSSDVRYRPQTQQGPMTYAPPGAPPSVS